MYFLYLYVNKTYKTYCDKLCSTFNWKFYKLCKRILQNGSALRQLSALDYVDFKVLPEPSLTEE